MAASIALATVAMIAAASATFAPGGRADHSIGAGATTVVTESRIDLCRAVVDFTARPPGTWADLGPAAAPAASAIVFGVEQAQVDPLCVAVALRDGKGWGALMNLGQVILRAAMVTPWTDPWDMKSQGSACEGS